MYGTVNSYVKKNNAHSHGWSVTFQCLLYEQLLVEMLLFDLVAFLLWLM